MNATRNETSVWGKLSFWHFWTSWDDCSRSSWHQPSAHWCFKFHGRHRHLERSTSTHHDTMKRPYSTNEKGITTKFDYSHKKKPPFQTYSYRWPPVVPGTSLHGPNPTRPVKGGVLVVNMVENMSFQSARIKLSIKFYSKISEQSQPAWCYLQCLRPELMIFKEWPHGISLLTSKIWRLERLEHANKMVIW